ncbi:MAG: O-antigen ligase family protein [Cyclobacteriaceae bacterium]|nr:O-antigen ligase family protein [Cyclobacteriaceae bacterium]
MNWTMLQNTFKFSTRAEFHQSLYLISLVALTLFFPYSFKVTRYITIFLVLNWVLQGDWKAKYQRLQSSTLFWFFLLYYFLHVIALFFTEDMKEGVFQLEKKLFMIILPLIILSSVSLTVNLLVVLLRLFVYSNILVAFLCFGDAVYQSNYFEGFTRIDWFKFTYFELTRVVDVQPAYLGIYCAFSILIVVIFLTYQWDTISISRKILDVFIVIILTLFLFLLSTRAPLVALMAMAFVGLPILFYRRGNFFRGALFSLLLFSGFVIVLLQFPILKERTFHAMGIPQETKWINQYGNATGVLPEYRYQNWFSSWEIIRSNWMIGVGSGDVQVELQKQYYANGFTDSYDQKFNAHNQYLQTWIGLGIVGLLSLLALFIVPIIKAFQEKNYLVILFVVLFAICSFTESTFERQLGIAFYTLFAVILSSAGLVRVYLQGNSTYNVHS